MSYLPLKDGQMNRLFCTLFLVYFFCAAVFCAAGTIDCTKAESAAERLICSDNDLLSADYELAYLYRVLQLAATDAQEVKRAQLAWIRRRNDCKDAQCLSAEYEKRMKEITQYLLDLSSSKGDSLRTDEYFDEAEISADFGDGPKDPLGKYRCCVVIDGSPCVSFIDFLVKFPDSVEVLTARVLAVKDRVGSLNFKFVDGWGNWAKGSFTPEGHKGTLKIEEVKPIDNPLGKKVLRMYGEYSLSKVKKGTCSRWKD